MERTATPPRSLATTAAEQQPASSDPDMARLASMGLEVRRATPASAMEAHALELEAFDAESAASEERFKSRQKQAPYLFYCLHHVSAPGGVGGGAGGGGRVVAHITSTCSEGELTEDSMGQHLEGGDNICIHSVAVKDKLRRRGIALAFLKVYLRRLAATPECSSAARVTLLAREMHVPLYEKVGFSITRQSPVRHGGHVWTELQVDMDRIRSDEVPQLQTVGNSNA
eukprot:Filipodium_phascolosomae@DN7918_c0_g1_i1.p1